MDSGRATFEIMKDLPHRSRLALGCAAAEHLFDLYRWGNMKYRAADVPDLPAHVTPESDIVELGLHIAWRFCTDNVDEPDVRRPIATMLNARPFIDASKTVAVPANGPIHGVTDVLLAIDTTDHVIAARAATRSRNGVFRLVQAFEADEDAPAKAKEQEAAWQLKVARLLKSHGDAPIHRKMFDELLAERLAWSRHLEAYRTKWQQT